MYKEQLESLRLALDQLEDSLILSRQPLVPAAVASFHEAVSKSTSEILRFVSSCMYAQEDEDRWGGEDGAL
jgi:hypothetical protein